MRWRDVNDFAEWYRAEGFPWRVPNDAQVYVTDMTYSVVTFREGRFQAELYLMKPDAKTTKHGHGIDTSLLFLGGQIRGYREGADPAGVPWGDLTGIAPSDRAHPDSGRRSQALPMGKWHQLVTRSRGGVVFVMQHWPEGQKPTSAALTYHGDPVGPEHQVLMGHR